MVVLCYNIKKYVAVVDGLGDAEGVLGEGQFDVLADCAVGEHVDH